jgi:hypothetical protein
MKASEPGSRDQPEPLRLLDGATVDARLRKLSELSAAAVLRDPRIDMSAGAVTQRLLECAEISALALELEWAGEQVRAAKAGK